MYEARFERNHMPATYETMHYRRRCAPELIRGKMLSMKRIWWFPISGMNSRANEAARSRATIADAVGAKATAAVAMATLAVGGLAIGFFVIGRLIVRELLVKRVHLGHLKIDQLDVEDLRVSKLTVLKEQRLADGPVHQSNEPSP